MQPIEMFPGMFWVGVNDRCTELFEGLWQIRDEGISYNSYLINDQKKAIIDLGSKATALELLEQIRSVIDPAGLDYIVICLLYTSDAADDLLCVDLGGRRII